MIAIRLRRTFFHSISNKNNHAAPKGSFWFFVHSFCIAEIFGTELLPTNPILCYEMERLRLFTIRKIVIIAPVMTEFKFMRALRAVDVFFKKKL